MSQPKWGFLPSADYLQPPESAPIKTQNCRFCMLYHLRHPDASPSPYCPLDLFSGDGGRIEKALCGQDVVKEAAETSDLALVNTHILSDVIVIRVFIEEKRVWI